MGSTCVKRDDGQSFPDYVIFNILFPSEFILKIFSLLALKE